MEKAAPLLLYYLLISKLLYPITSKYIDLLQQLKLQKTWASIWPTFLFTILPFLKRKRKVRLYFPTSPPNCTITSSLNHFLLIHYFTLSRQYHTYMSYQMYLFMLFLLGILVILKYPICREECITKAIILFPHPVTVLVNSNLILLGSTLKNVSFIINLLYLTIKLLLNKIIHLILSLFLILTNPHGKSVTLNPNI